MLTAPDLAPAMAGALLTALRAKGVTAEEVRGFAGAMRTLARKPALPANLGMDAIDIVGTGGDGSGQLESVDRRGTAGRRLRPAGGQARQSRRSRAAAAARI